LAHAHQHATRPHAPPHHLQHPPPPPTPHRSPVSPLPAPPPPRPTLFPYTTLFRSHAAGLLADGDHGDHHGREHFRLGERSGDGRSESTRLNSSHRTISYAVFCLKKKKKEQVEYVSCR